MVRCRLVPRVDVGYLLGGDIAAVESVVASIHEACPDHADFISSEPTAGVRDAEHSRKRRRLEDAALDGDEIDSYNDASEVRCQFKRYAS